MITLKKSSGSQSGMRMKATPRAAKKKEKKNESFSLPKCSFPSTSEIQVDLKAYRLISDQLHTV